MFYWWKSNWIPDISNIFILHTGDEQMSTYSWGTIFIYWWCPLISSALQGLGVARGPEYFCSLARKIVTFTSRATTNTTMSISHSCCPINIDPACCFWTPNNKDHLSHSTDFSWWCSWSTVNNANLMAGGHGAENQNYKTTSMKNLLPLL